jgi:hypothetical protein
VGGGSKAVGGQHTAARPNVGGVRFEHEVRLLFDGQARHHELLVEGKAGDA